MGVWLSSSYLGTRADKAPPCYLLTTILTELHVPTLQHRDQKYHLTLRLRKGKLETCADFHNTLV